MASSRLPKYQGSKIPPTSSSVTRKVQNADDLLERKVEAELKCKTLDENIKIYQQKALVLVQQKDEEEHILLERLQKTAILRARASLSRDQTAVCQDLKERAESINLKLACRLTEEVGSPEHFVFNPNAKKLESALKSSIKACLESGDKSPKLVLDAVKDFSCEERLSAVMELQDELKTDMTNLVSSININDDAAKLGDELRNSPLCKMALRPLSEHIKDFAIKNARYVLDGQDIAHENKKLQKELKGLLSNNPDLSAQVKALMESEKSEILQRHLHQLTLENQTCGASDLQQEQTLKKIILLHKELENLRTNVMKGLSTLENISYHQQQLMDEIQGGSRSCKDFDKMSEIEDHLSSLLKELYLLPLPSSLDKAQDIGKEEISKKSYIWQLDMHIDHAVDNHKASLETFDQFKANIAKSSDDILCGAKAIEDTICKARKLYLDHSSVPKQFCDKLETWKNNPVESKLVEDLDRRVNDLTLQEWVDIFTESYPEINQICN